MCRCSSISGLVKCSMKKLLYMILLLVCVWSCYYGGGFQLQGDITINAMFPLHNSDTAIQTMPYLADCKRGTANRHGYFLAQALRYTVEEINNSSQLLPGISLGYQTYDTCSVPASILATVDLLAQQHNKANVESRAVALIGPDSSSYAFTPAAALSSYLIPMISYEASNEMLSNIYLYPSFFRTIPSDKNQVHAMIGILVKFNWTWVAVVGSDNSYGLQGMLSLSQQASDYDVCIAYQAVIPSLSANTSQRIRDIVRNIIKTKVNTIVVFSSKRIAKGFFRFVIEENITGKVWIGSEDWTVATLISDIPGISTIGTVLGIAIKYTAFTGFQDFVNLSLKPGNVNTYKENISVPCLQNKDPNIMKGLQYVMGNYDITSSFNVYQAMYTVANALHHVLGCDSKKCQKKEAQPWQVLQYLKQVRFSIRNTSVYFDSNGDPPTGYDIVSWVWKNTTWSLRVVGTFTPHPIDIQVDPSQIQWQGEISGINNVPESRCSPECTYGHKRLQIGQHKCCFKCIECPASTFLNKTRSTSCQSCKQDQWSLPKSEECVNRTLLYLRWSAPLAIMLLFLLALTLLLTLFTAVIFLLNLSTPVVKSAGGRTCLLMLLSLTVASCCTLLHFGLPSRRTCVFRKSLFILSFTVCLICMTVRSFQVVYIFKWSSKFPRFYETWIKNRGPDVFILITSLGEFLIFVIGATVSPSVPLKNYDFYYDCIILECSKNMARVLVEILYVFLLSVFCFCLSYIGKDLPANYNEAKCISFSLMIYFISWISFFTAYSINRGTLSMALEVAAILFSVLGILSGYFLPKVYIILLKPQMNTTAHFKNCIQMYTMNK